MEADATGMIVPGKNTTRKRVLVADDHPLFRHGVMDLIDRQADMVVCGEADSISSAQAKLAEKSPHLIVLGLRLGNGDTLEFIKWLRAQYPGVQILVFSPYEELFLIERLLRAGANGCLMKKAAREELLAAIRDILRGEVYVSRDIAILAFKRLLETRPKNRLPVKDDALDILSDREIHVFQLIGSGMGTKKIAESLKLSVKTIESHRENMKRKLGLNSGAELKERAAKWVEARIAQKRAIPARVRRKKRLGLRSGKATRSLLHRENPTIPKGETRSP